MGNLIVKSLLVVILILVFGSFQYGGINTPPPFPNSWQTYFVGTVLFMAIILLAKKIIEYFRPDWEK